MNKRLWYAAPITLALFLAGCSAIKTQEGDAPIAAQKRTTGFMGLATQDDVEVQLAKAFAGVDRVVIGGFKVGFNDSKRYDETRTGVFSGGSTTTALVKLAGIDDTVRQAITDQAYAQFVQMLEDKGYQVVPRSLLLQDPAYQKTTESDFPYKVDQSGLFSSYGVGHYYSPTDVGPRQAFFPGENDSQFFAGMGGQGAIDAADKFGAQNDVRVLAVSYMVDFAGAASGAYFSSTLLEVGQLMAVDTGQLVMSRNETGIRTATNAMLKLGQPIGSDVTFATIENVTTDGEVAAEVAANAVAGLFRGGLIGAFSQQASQTREFVFTADPALYTQAASDAIGQANTALVNKMAELRSPS